MIIGLGHDLVRVARIERTLDRQGKAFTARCFAPEEIAVAQARPVLLTATYAKAFAAKEACAKALGTGFRNGIAFRDIILIRDTLGKPQIRLEGAALARLNSMVPVGATPHIHISLTDEAGLVYALVLLEVT